jgi:hypothetical protein
MTSANVLRRRSIDTLKSQYRKNHQLSIRVSLERLVSAAQGETDSPCRELNGITLSFNNKPACDVSIWTKNWRQL